MNLEEYTELIKEIKSKVKSNPLTICILDNMSKDRRMQEINESKNMPSKKQIDFIEALGIKTKEEASKLIGEKLKENGKNG